MPRPTPRELTVKNKALLTPNMLRLTLGGEDLADFPADQSSAYIKLMLPSNDGGVDMRTYTVRAQRDADLEIDIDFMLHGLDGEHSEKHTGPAVAWVTAAEVGDLVSIAGPGGKKLLDFDADWFFLAGDMTALPAISVNVEQLPSDAKGYAVIEVLHKDDAQNFDLPKGFECHWVVNTDPGYGSTVLIDRVKEMPWLAGNPSVWAACEFTTMRALRRYFKQERQLSKRAVYVSSYWKRGLSEQQHKVLKSEDAATFDGE